MVPLKKRSKIIKEMSKQVMQLYGKIMEGENRSGRAVVSEFIEWQRCQCVKRVSLRYGAEDWNSRVRHLDFILRVLHTSHLVDQYHLVNQTFEFFHILPSSTSSHSQIIASSNCSRHVLTLYLSACPHKGIRAFPLLFVFTTTFSCAPKLLMLGLKVCTAWLRHLVLVK